MCQPQHVSAPECHLQAVYEHKGSQVQRSTSGIQHVSAQEYHLQAVYEHKSNAPLQVLIALVVVFKTLKC